MTPQTVSSAFFLVGGLIAAGVAIGHERRMQRHRQPGITYAQVTLRRDGGWRRSDLFTREGLAHQRKASVFGIIAIGFWILALASWIVLGS